jgi:hypothetical protein
MARPSTSHVLKAFEISKVVNEIVDINIMGQCSSSDDSDSDDDQSQSVTPRTHN